MSSGGGCPGSRSLIRRILLAGLAILPAAHAQAQWAGVVERGQTTESPALGRPLVYNVYRPAAVPAAGRRWPTLYLLEGRPAEADWLDQGFVYEVIDQAVAEGLIPPTLVVIPVTPFSWYVDNPDPGGQGMMRTAILQDLAPAIDARYPTAACREGRAIAGVSMGGYGALLYGLERPDAFVAAASFSGAIAPPIDARDVQRLKRADAFYDGAFGRPLDRGRFNAWNLFTRVRQWPAGEEPAPAILLAAGDRDRSGLIQSTARFHAELLRAGLDSSLRIGPGAHDWPTWRAHLADALRWLGPKLRTSCEPADSQVQSPGREATRPTP
ncbi:alpha/beta hydrolase [Hansschlegelia beijingensis]|uniref:alpha/beta hydrolase n=1 Tax=Hansschlegelia beijingensis TaxID=1133344 RepID=UPI00387F1F46